MVQTQVLRLARLADAAGIDGLVCSAEEVAAVRKAMEPEALLAVQGIRPAGTVSSDDQSRRSHRGTGDCAWGFQAGGGPADYAGGGPGRGCSRDSGRDPKRGGLATRVRLALLALKRLGYPFVLLRPRPAHLYRDRVASYAVLDSPPEAQDETPLTPETGAVGTPCSHHADPKGG